MTNKRPGRVGDSPIIGAGTYAKNGVCAVSATGHGEYFIRAVAAHQVCASVEYRGVSLAQAVHEMLHEVLRKLGGDGGMIAIDHARRHRHGLQQRRHVPRRARLARPARDRHLQGTLGGLQVAPAQGARRPRLPA